MTVRILLVEDVPEDAELTEREVRRSGLDCTIRRVAARDDFRRTLLEYAPDVIISDHNLPGFTGRDALEITRELAPHTPFVLVTGSLDEETAVEYMKAGASDYVLKDRLARLGAAVASALEGVRQRRAVRDYQHLLQRVIDADPSLVFVRDWDGRFVMVNRAVAEAFGTSVNVLVGRTVTELAPGFAETDRSVLADDRQVMTSGRGMLIPEEPITNPATGETRWFQTVKVPLVMPHDATPKVLTVSTDITARRDAEARYRQIFDTAPLGIFQEAPHGRIVTANAAIAHMLGYESSSELIGLDMAADIYLDPEQRVDVEARSARAGGAKEFELIWRRKDGARIWIHLTTQTHRDRDGRPLLLEGFVRDITERKQLEEQLLQSQKMEAVGRLAGGIAHDFNNLLTAIIGYCDLILMDAPETDPRREDVGEIKSAAHRAASLTRQLLAFSRKQVLQPRVLNLNDVLANVDRMLRRLIGEDIELRTLLAPDLRRVVADPGQIEQVIMNLAVNARDAMPQGGGLTIQTSNVGLDDAYAARHFGAVAGEYVMVAVTDTGTGMDESVRARIFEPFFTTKGPGQGTGLGLSMVYGIVKQSGGYIWVYSEPGRGTTFKIYLPPAAADAQDAPPAAEAPSSLHGTETILVAEDDGQLRGLASRVLQAYGYRVLVAGHGQEAIEVSRKENGAIDLLLTDVVMPEMSGYDLALRLVADWPKIRVLYMSGYTDDAIVHHGVLAPGVAYVEKPFTAESLARRVRGVLDAPPQVSA